MSIDKGISAVEPVQLTDRHYRDLRRRLLARLAVMYLGPLIILAAYFYWQYESMVTESQRLHLKAIAESQANTIDLFLFERLQNLTNTIDDIRPGGPPSHEQLERHLAGLRRNSEAFIDLGYFDATGTLAAYAGPIPSLEDRNYAEENWYRTLRDNPDQYIITDIHLGFRKQPHFTIAVARRWGEMSVVYRATLDPDKMYEYVRSLESAEEVTTSLVNREGLFQMVSPAEGELLGPAPLLPVEQPRVGIQRVDLADQPALLAYAWLHSVDWGVIVRLSEAQSASAYSGFRLRIIGIALFMFVVGSAILYTRANRMIEQQRETDRTRVQLGHAAKLASVGELAAGIAHEINNPLAAINEEAGLLKDLLSEAYKERVSRQEIVHSLDSIQSLVFRCRDITHKLLGFVRKQDIELLEHNVNELMENVVEGLLGHELAVSPIRVNKSYNYKLPPFLTDGNQLEQVFLNLIKNAIDAIGDREGEIRVATDRDNGNILVTIQDTGKGMSPQQLDMIFMPFYSTKEVGQGTGLGLSVSYGIIKSLHGHIDVSSEIGVGTTFTIRLPIHAHGRVTAAK